MQINEKKPPRAVCVHYTKDVAEWLPGYVDEAVRHTGKKAAEIFRDAFCEKWGKVFPELASRFEKLKRLSGGE